MGSIIQVDDIQVGQMVTLHSFRSAPDGSTDNENLVFPNAMKKTPMGVPMRVKGLSLLFVACEMISPDGREIGPAIVDVRFTRICELDSEYVNAVINPNRKKPNSCSSERSEARKTRFWNSKMRLEQPTRFRYHPNACTHSTSDAILCGVCGDRMDAEFGVYGATSFVEGMSGRKHLHDCYTCPNHEEAWHRQVVSLWKEKEKTCSTAIEALLSREIKTVLANRKPTKDA